METTRNLEPGDVVQINPEHDPTFGGCFLLIERVHRWGVQGFVEVPGKGRAYYRCPHEACAYVGKAEWVPEGLRKPMAEE